MNAARSSELALFFKLLANLLAAGYSPAESLAQLVQGRSSRRLQGQLRQLLATLPPNATLAYYLRLRIFGLDEASIGLFEQTASVGEQVALLHALSARYSQANWVNQVRGVSMYWPLLYFIIGSFAFVMVTEWVLPFFAEFYASMGSPLPLATSSLMMLKSWMLLLFLALLAAFFTLRFRPAWVRAPIDWLRLYSPLGPWFEKIALARFTHMLALLLAKNLHPRHALIMASTAAENVVIQRRLQTAFAAAAASPIAGILKSCRLVPGDFATAIGIAEKTQTLAEILPELAEASASALVRHTRTLNNIVDTVAKVLVASALAWIAFAIYLPLFKLGALI